MTIDAFFASDAAARFVATRPGTVALRAFDAAAPRADEGDYGPLPAAPVELTLSPGSTTAKVDGAEETVEAVVVETRALGWAFERTAASVVVRTASRSLIVSETIAAAEEDANTELQPLASALAGYVGLTEESAADGPSRPAPSPAGRFTVRLEGERIVLRDLEGRGPKERVMRYRMLALVSLVLGLVGVFVFVSRYRAGASSGALFGVGVVPVVLFVGAFAMNEIARYANQYRAKSSPLAWFADDRVVVAPWVSRDGAVGTLFEGRLGAAVTCAEINDVEVRSRDGEHAVTLDGLHGPIEVLVTPDADIAAHYREIVATALAKAQSPKKRVTALMRAAAAREQAR